MVEQMRDNPELITIEQAARILGCRPRTVQLRMLREPLTRYRSPHDRRVRLLDRREVEDLLRFEVVMPREQVA